MVWRCSSLFAEFLLQQLWETLDLSIPRLVNAHHLPARRVLELGAGTGILPACLFANPDWVQPGVQPLEWISTDRSENMQLLEKNVGRCRLSNDRVRVTVCELDWLNLDAAQGRSLDLIRKHVLSFYGASQEDLAYPELIVSMDCVYNPALHRPLVKTIHTFCKPNYTKAFLMIQLRDVDNTRNFLETWNSFPSFKLYHLEDYMLPPAMRSGFTAFVAIRVT